MKNTIYSDKLEYNEEWIMKNQKTILKGLRGID